MKMGVNVDVDVMSIVKNAIMLIILLVVVLFIVTYFGLVNCSAIPFWCDIYETVVGTPRVLIVHGDSGLGDPESLQIYLKDPRIVGAEAVDLQHINNISLGNLGNYKLVIVEHCRQASYEQLQMFMNYVNQGGRLVWVADSGVEKGANEVQNISDINALVPLDDNPWVRVEKTGQYILNFDEFLTMRYIANYCEEKDCVDDMFSVGALEPEPTRNHPLIFGSAAQMNFKINKERNFAIVKQIPNSPNSNVVMSLDFGGNITGKENEIGRSVPFIVTSGIGNRVAYYAYPPEWLVQDNNSYILIKNMYYGMLGK